MAYDVALSTMITAPVSRRLRTLAVLEDRPLTHLVDELLGRVLPSAAELALRLSAGEASASAPEAGAAAPPETDEAATVSISATALSTQEAA